MSSFIYLGRSGSAASDYSKPPTTQRISLALVVFFLPMLLALLAVAANAAPIAIANVGGYSVAGFVANGRWTGQPPMAKPPRSNAYLNFLAVETAYDGPWQITGKNFGASQGTVQLLDAKTLKPLLGVSLTVFSWADTKITIIPIANYSFAHAENIVLLVSRLQSPVAKRSDSTALWIDNLVGLIKTRGYGQCTWNVAKIRQDNGLRIPPSAYDISGSITETKYLPQRFDSLNYGNRHVGIITSAPSKTSNRDGSVTWQFIVTEMNAWADEKESVFAATFIVKDAGKVRTIIKGIGSNAGATYLATGYFR